MRAARGTSASTAADSAWLRHRAGAVLGVTNRHDARVSKVSLTFATTDGSLTLGMLFEAPAVANLADHVRRERGDVRQPSGRAAPDVTITVMHDPSRRP